MSYYGTGDYYLAGDPGLFSSIGGFVKGAVGGLITGGPIGAITGGIRGISSGGSGRFVPPVAIPRFGGGGSPSVPSIDPRTGRPRKKYRRMNYGNTKALKRANRRIDGFVGEARKALKHTNYKIVSKSAGKRGGTRGVITAAEARRALRN